ncbi:uncharacterized protein TRUGW13939_04598 [Talaromyces rugulosus]|uniref:FAD-binding domain-containing protein n=1 Tax=Talaromyces rugulosus TaxID=121627 RepID=A0A7H8QU11_TALRU|nr:uncharacterized protein TRUGW13939_04598 [Talaromyces rugulosus]QKX57484.1 hypothetical protein TRUGW13939_04598 [Talaromyces rugulosus]
MAPLRIAIIGAGPAGLTLARLLQVKGIPYTIYDLDAHAYSRDQGGTVDLHRRGGQMVLEEAGLLEEFKKLSRPEGEATKLVKYDGTVLVDENVEKVKRLEEHQDRPEIDRLVLRQLLLGSLTEGNNNIVWGKKLLGVEESNGKIDLQFADGVEKAFDIVVGADGAWSKVRPFLTDEKPFYSGITAIELWATNVDAQHQWLSQYVGQGSMFMFDQGRAVISQRNGNNTIRTYAAVKQPETWSNDCGIDWSKPEAKTQLIEGYFIDCADDLKRVIIDSNDNLVVRSMYMLPVDIKWEPKAGVTLIGDAAHLMTPFAGVGVNIAMVDALDLSRAIASCVDNKENIGTAVSAFEKEMFQRSQMFANKTWKNMQSHFSATGIEERAALARK